MLATQAKLNKFKVDIQWADWEPTLVNYLRQIPGSTGVPLSYVIRSVAIPAAAPIIGSVLESYIKNVPLVGAKFEADTQSVHTLILTFLITYSEIEFIVITAIESDDRMAYLSLVARFEIIGCREGRQGPIL